MPRQPDLSAPILVTLLAFAALAFAPQIFNDGDTYWHVAAGARMLADHAVLYRDPFSYTFQDAPWNAHEWLSEIFMALAFRAGGWGGVAILFAGAFALTAGSLCLHLRRWLTWPAWPIVLVLALACMAGSLLARPHLLALPLLEIWTAGLVIARSERRAPHWGLLPVMTLWANLHGGFVFGFLLLALLALEALVEAQDKRKTLVSWALFGTGAVAAALVTPHFTDGFLFPFRLVAMRELGNVAEWQPTSFATLSPFELAILGSFYFTLSRGVKLPAGRVLIALLLTHLALSHLRHQIVFAVAAPLILAEPVAKVRDMQVANAKRAGQYAIVLGALIAMLAISAARLSLALPRGGELATPEAALAHVPKDVRQAPVLNDYSFGGYLIFKGVRPFIDSRAELYGDAFLGNYARIVSPDPKALRATLERYKIRWSILPPASPTVAVLDLMPGWHRLYGDDVAVVHVRNR